MSHERKALDEIASGAGDAIYLLCKVGYVIAFGAIMLSTFAAALGIAWRVFRVAAGM